MTGLFAALFILGSWSASPGPIADIERISPEAAVERATQCGLGRVAVRYENDLQSDILTVANATSATDSQLACLDKAAGWGIFVELPSNLQARFDAIREARATALAVEQGRDWLSTRGLLAQVPKYVAGITDESAFTRNVERLCGPRASGAFQSQYGFHAISPEWAKKMSMPPTPDDIEVFACLSHVMTVAGYKVVIVGNEAYAPEK